MVRNLILHALRAGAVGELNVGPGAKMTQSAVPATALPAAAGNSLLLRGLLNEVQYIAFENRRAGSKRKFQCAPGVRPVYLRGDTIDSLLSAEAVVASGRTCMILMHSQHAGHLGRRDSQQNKTLSTEYSVYR